MNIQSPLHPPILTVSNVHKAFDPALSVLRGVDLEVAAGEIVCLLGPSGCGKTTLLRIVAGLTQPDRGDVRFQGQDLAQVPVHRRNFGLMFQEFALFPHRTVGENVAFGLRMAGWPSARVRQRVAEMLALVSLEGYQDRSVFELSGGERQRVALARSLAPSPSLLMLDEPLGSLDRSLREELMNELRDILKRVGVTALYVTHDQQEAFAVADWVVVMDRGEIEQVGRPEEVYRRPASVFVARFLGLNNLLPATVTEREPRAARTPLGRFALSEPAWPGEYVLLIRPEAVTLDEVGDEGGEDGEETYDLSGVLRVRSFRGSHYHIEVDVTGDDGDHRLAFDLPGRRWRQVQDMLPEVDQPVRLSVDPDQVILLPR